MSFTTASNRACANDSASTITALPPRKLSHQNFVTTLPPTHTGDAHRCEGHARQKCGARAANRRNPRAISGMPVPCGGAATKLERTWFICSSNIIYGTDYNQFLVEWNSGTPMSRVPWSLDAGRTGRGRRKVPTWMTLLRRRLSSTRRISMMTFARRMCARCVTAIRSFDDGPVRFSESGEVERPVEPGERRSGRARRVRQLDHVAHADAAVVVDAGETGARGRNEGRRALIAP